MTTRPSSVHVCVWEQVRVTRRVQKKERFISVIRWFVAAPKNRICDGNDFDGVCACALLSRFVYLPRGALQIKCTCCLIHRLNRQPWQSARMLRHVRVHTTSDAGDEYGDEDKSANIWSEGLEMVSEGVGGSGGGGRVTSPWPIADDWAYVRLCT